MAQAGRGKIKGGTWMGTLIHALKKRLKEREKENRSRGAKPPNLLIIAPYGLASLPFLLAPRKLHSYAKYPHFMHVHAKTKETSR